LAFAHKEVTDRKVFLEELSAHIDKASDERLENFARKWKDERGNDVNPTLVASLTDQNGSIQGLVSSVEAMQKQINLQQDNRTNTEILTSNSEKMQATMKLQEQAATKVVQDLGNVLKAQSQSAEIQALGDRINRNAEIVATETAKANLEQRSEWSKYAAKNATQDSYNHISESIREANRREANVRAAGASVSGAQFEGPGPGLNSSDQAPHRQPRFYAGHRGDTEAGHASRGFPWRGNPNQGYASHGDAGYHRDIDTLEEWPEPEGMFGYDGNDFFPPRRKRSRHPQSEWEYYHEPVQRSNHHFEDRGRGAYLSLS
jgi:hypothetical protein